MCDRPAEVGDQTVAELLGDMAIESSDDSLTRVVVGGEDFGPVFRIQLPRKPAGANEIAEIAVRWRRSPARGRGSFSEGTNWPKLV